MFGFLLATPNGLAYAAAAMRKSPDSAASDQDGILAGKCKYQPPKNEPQPVRAVVRVAGEEA